MKALAAKLPSRPLQAAPMATPAPASMAAKLVVWLHPIHWYSMPALQKLWLDDVLTDGWAYGARPDAPGTALRGKALWLVTSTGGPAESYRPDGYNKYPFEAFLPPYAQTAGLCGMHFLPPLVLHGANRVSDAGLNQHADTFFTTLNTHASGHAPWNTLPPG